MGKSNGEVKIKTILDDLGIIYDEEVMVPGLTATSGRPLRFDFMVYDDSGEAIAAIEYNGEQHYEPVKYFGGKSALKRQQYNDNNKKMYCQKNNIRFIEIPYWNYEKINAETLLKALGL